MTSEIARKKKTSKKLTFSEIKLMYVVKSFSTLLKFKYVKPSTEIGHFSISFINLVGFWLDAKTPPPNCFDS